MFVCKMKLDLVRVLIIEEVEVVSFDYGLK